MMMARYDDQHVSVLTLELTLTWLETAPLTDIQKRDFKSAVWSTSDWLGKPPDEVPANPAALRRLFKTISPGGAGVTRKRFANVKSGINQLLRAMGIVSRPIHKMVLSPKWMDHIGPIEDVYDGYFMRRLGRPPISTP
jgi:hypothetical protein